MNYDKKKVIRKIAILEHEIEYYSKVYTNCHKVQGLKQKLDYFIDLYKNTNI